MTAVVVDTNVPVVANDQDDSVASDCVLNCVQRLRRVQSGERIVLDDGFRVLYEYMRNLSMSGQPGVGDAFMKWVWQIAYTPEHCELVTLSETEGDPDDFQEIPDDSGLEGFDRADRKFVAIALASASHPVVLNATDSDWWDYRVPLRELGVRIEFVCPDRFAENLRRS